MATIRRPGARSRPPNSRRRSNAISVASWRGARGSPAQEEARISAEELKAALESDDDGRPVLLDVCQSRDLPRRFDMLAGASMHAPSALSQWIEQLPRDRPIAVYCICGFQVSGTAVTELRRRGYNARALIGGITAWHAIGGTTVPLDTSTYEKAT